MGQSTHNLHTDEEQIPSPRVAFQHGPLYRHHPRRPLDAPEDPTSPPATDLIDVPLGRHAYSPDTSSNSSDSSEDIEEVMDSDSESTQSSEEIMNTAMETSMDHQFGEDSDSGSQASEVDEMDSDWEENSNSDSESEGDVTGTHMQLRSTSGVGNLMGKSAFKELLNEIGQEEVGMRREFKISNEAIHILQRESETMLIELFRKANNVAKAGNREKLEVTDIYAARQIDEIMKKSFN